MKNFKRLLCCAAVIVIVTLSIAFAFSSRSNRQLQNRVQEQSKIIDSLLNRRIKAVDVELYVTDKSKNVIYGRYNKGTITMPQERKYILEVDSISIK